MMTEERLMLREQISALADGQLEGERFAAVVGKVGGDEEARDSWQMYHLIGDVLRSGEAGACMPNRGRDRRATDVRARVGCSRKNS